MALISKDAIHDTVTGDVILWHLWQWSPKTWSDDICDNHLPRHDLVADLSIGTLHRWSLNVVSPVECPQ